jgi:uncharacterized protein YoxC
MVSKFVKVDSTVPTETVVQIPNQPIIIATYEGEITVNKIYDLQMDVADKLATLQEKAYLIIQMKNISSSVIAIWQTMARLDTNVSGTINDPHVAGHVFVGKDEVVKIFIHGMKKRHNQQQITVFAEMEDAIAAIRRLIQVQQTSAG